MKLGKKRLRETSLISSRHMAGLTLFITGFSLPLLRTLVREHIGGAYLTEIGLLIGTLGVAALVLRRGGRRRVRGLHIILIFLIFDLLLLYFMLASRLFPAPAEMEVSANIAEGLKEVSSRNESWLYLSDMFEGLSSSVSFRKPEVWWVYKVLSHGEDECEDLLLYLNKSIELGAREEAEILIRDLSRMFEGIDSYTSNFLMYYLFLSTLALFFSTIMFLGGKGVKIGVSDVEVSGSLFTYSYPLLLSLGLACSLYTAEPYPMFSWVPYTLIMLITFRLRGYDRSALFGFCILTGGLLGAYSPVYPFACLWYFFMFCLLMLVLLPSAMPGISRDILLAMSILAGCSGVNGAISMTFIHTNVPPAMALISVVYDLISIIFALSEISALPEVLSGGTRSVIRKGLWPILGFITSVLLLAFCLLAQFNPAPSLHWVLFLSLLCYALIYSMRLYSLRRRRLAKFGEIGDSRALLLVIIPNLAFLGIFPTLYRVSDPYYLLLASASFFLSALVFSIWYVRGDRSLRNFLLESSGAFYPYIVISISGPILSLLNLKPPLHYIPIMMPSLCLLAILRRDLRRRFS